MATDAVAEIKARLDIVDVIGAYTTITRAGRSYKGLCPFHSEKTPSFTVSQERQAWYCFGCSEGGDVFAFVQKMERTDFRSALQQLAERAGVELEDRADPVQRGAARRRKRTRELNAKAAAYFAHVLWETPAGEAGRALLKARGVEESVARQFGIGFAPSGGRSEDALVRYLVSRAEATVDECVDAGLGHHSRAGGGRDRFRHRLVFPIRDERGDVIAFGARALGDDQPKYLNSPETAVYHKSLAIFGLDMAREAMRAADTAVIVEGYFDVVSAHVAGITNVVASSGTALTREQVKVLARLVKNIVLCFDNDAAGVAATDRAVEIIAAEGVAAKIVALPEGVKDPGDLMPGRATELRAAVADARPEWQVLLDRALGDGEGGSVEARRTAAEQAAAMLHRIPEASTRDLYVQQAATRLGLGVASLQADVDRAARSTAPRPARVVAAAPPDRVAPPLEQEEPLDLTVPQSWERYLAAVVAARPETARVLTEGAGISLDEFRHPVVRRLMATALALPPGDAMPLHALGPSEQSLASRLLLDPPPELDENAPAGALATALASAIRRLREASRETQLEAVVQSLRVARDSGRDDESVALAARLVELRKARDGGRDAEIAHLASTLGPLLARR